MSFVVGSFCFALASSVTAIVVKLASNVHFLDIPIDRSAHTIPTPTGGGIAFVLPYAVVLFLLYKIELLGKEELIALCFAFLIALLGLVDDIKPIDFRVRLPVQVIFGLVALVMLLPMAPLQIGKYSFSGEIALFILAFISLIWMTNLYNFMDGIDGLAVSELIFISAAIVCFSAYEGDLKLQIISVSLLFSGVAFGLWNWAPAKIFMGDLGSGFLGFVLGILALISLRTGTMNAWTWLLLIGVFACDATMTLIVRLVSGLPIHEGHASHAYQILADRLSSHSSVVILLMLVNVVWLFPLAVFSHLKPSFAASLAFLGLCPIILLVCYLRFRHSRGAFSEQ
jgi:Fuc2NAc and GlcNAc transferase